MSSAVWIWQSSISTGSLSLNPLPERGRSSWPLCATFVIFCRENISGEERHAFLVPRIRGAEIDPFACEVATLSLILADYPRRKWVEDFPSRSVPPGRASERDRVRLKPKSTPTHWRRYAVSRELKKDAWFQIKHPLRDPGCGLPRRNFRLLGLVSFFWRTSTRT